MKTTRQINNYIEQLKSDIERIEQEYTEVLENIKENDDINMFRYSVMLKAQYGEKIAELETAELVFREFNRAKQ